MMRKSRERPSRRSGARSTSSHESQTLSYDDRLSKALRESQRESELATLRDHSAWIWSDLVETYSAHEHYSMGIEALAEQRNARSSVKTRPSRKEHSFSERYSSIVENLQSVYETLQELYNPGYAARFDLKTLEQKAEDVNRRLLDIRVGLQKQIDIDREYLNSLETGVGRSSGDAAISDQPASLKDSAYAESLSNVSLTPLKGSNFGGLTERLIPMHSQKTESAGKHLELKGVAMRVEDPKERKTEILDVWYHPGALYRLTTSNKPAHSFVFVLEAYIGSQQVRVALDLNDVVEGAGPCNITRIPTHWNLQTEGVGSWLIKLWDSNKVESWPLLRFRICDADQQAQGQPRIVSEKLDHELCRRVAIISSFDDA